MKPVTKKTRAKKTGSIIKCPDCKKVGKVYHFAWLALKCQHCFEMINKTDWLLVEPLKDQSIFQKILEFDTPDGQRLLAEDEGSGIVKISKFDGKFYRYSCRINSKFKPKSIYDCYSVLP